MPPIVPTPTVPINFVPAREGDVLQLGKITMRIMEDGSRTDNRLSVAHFTLPPNSSGPPPHWHEMHDETFLVTKGTVRFHVPEAPGLEGKIVDAKEGDYVVVPVRAPHTFSNASGETAEFVNTFTPAFYIHYFKLLSSLAVEGKEMTPDINAQAMAYYATIPVKQ